jgi:hypothetical protein
VGFGDYYALSNLERCFSIPIMFFGVMIFSFVIGIYGEQLEKMKSIDKDHEEGNALLLFFDVMKYFNENESIKKELRDEIEEFFMYRWTNHRTLPLESDEGKEMLNKMDRVVMPHIYLGFLYEPFMKVFGRTFSI